MGETVIRARDVRMRYGRAEVLRGVDLDVRAGEVMTLLGPNGAGRLSGGQRRRLDVALGIVGRPELLFLDEPTSGFDPEARREFHGLVEGLARNEGMTVLLTTHDLAEAERLADRIAILVGGRVTVCATPSGLASVVQAASEVRWLEDGAQRTERTSDPSRTAFELHRRFGGPVPGLEVRRPSLEQSYLDLVAGVAGPVAGSGRELEDRRAA